MAPTLEHCLTTRGYLSKENTVDLKAIKNGPSRIVVAVPFGFVKGTGPAEGLEAEILPSSGDWLLVRLPRHRLKKQLLEISSFAKTP